MHAITPPCARSRISRAPLVRRDVSSRVIASEIEVAAIRPVSIRETKLTTRSREFVVDFGDSGRERAYILVFFSCFVREIGVYRSWIVDVAGYVDEDDDDALNRARMSAPRTSVRVRHARARWQDDTQDDIRSNNRKKIVSRAIRLLSRSAEWLLYARVIIRTATRNIRRAASI